VTRATQSLLLTLTGVVLLRMAIGDTYLNYVNAWMKWPLIGSGALLVVLGLAEVFRGEAPRSAEDEPESAHVPRAAWLIFAPSLVFFLIAPPALGAAFADRAQPASVSVDADEAGSLPALPATDPAPLLLDELMMRAWFDDGATLADRDIEITGFVSHDKGGWYVTRFMMSCCAADAYVMRVRASGADAPPDDQWVRVVGRHVAGTGSEGESDPEVVVGSLDLIETPRNPYE
jgi:uncharacterized repeat protein (TIGR03943 family)